MNKLEFAERCVLLRGRPISFAERPYLRGPYLSQARRQVLRASRQVEKTTFLAITILHAVVTYPGLHVLYVCPRQEQAQLFSRSRLQPMIRESPILTRALLGGRRGTKVSNLVFRNGSEVYIRAAFHSADQARGIDADYLLIDEYQDIASGALAVLEEALSHSAHRRVLLAGTPKLIDNHLESAFRVSTAAEYQVRCSACQRDTILDERTLGLLGPICPTCQHPLRPREGRWVERNPTSSWGSGYWINHLMVPWLHYPELLEHQRTYDPAQFKNECLGLPSTLGDHIVTRADLEACCEPRSMARGLKDLPAAGRRALVAGVDWGGGVASRTVLALGYLDRQYRFHVVRCERFGTREEPERILDAVAERLLSFRIGLIAADGAGHGLVYNRLLVSRLSGQRLFYAIHYSAAHQEPYEDGVLWHWTVGRSSSLGNVFARVRKRMLLFPRLEESGTYLDEICCETAEYDDHQRRLHYRHPETQPDDTLHSLNYALLLATRAFPRQQAAAQELL